MKELENDVQKLSDIFNKRLVVSNEWISFDISSRRVLFVQSFNKIKQDDDEDDDENNDLEQNLNSQEERPTPVSFWSNYLLITQNKILNLQEEAEELMKQLTTKIWKTTDEILRAHTGIS